jgi:chromosome partitioning protein
MATTKIVAKKTARKIVVASDKGGVGKTTLAVHIAGWLARYHSPGRVLFIDLDPKADATSIWLGYGEAHGTDPGCTIYHVLVEDHVLPEEAILRVELQIGRKPSEHSIDVIRSHKSAAEAYVELLRAVGGESKLASWLEQVADQYDYIIMDVPPDPGNLLKLNALAAADWVIVPAEPEPFALVGMQYLTKEVNQINKTLRKLYRMPDLEIHGVVAISVDDRTNLHREAVEELRSSFGERFLGSIPRRIGVPTAAKEHLDMFGYENGNWSDVTHAFADIAKKAITE